LKQSLNDAGYTAYQRKGSSEDGEALFRVFVGPELERADARELKRRIALDEAFELEGLVVPYHP
jgi:cell division septation protein DedD